MSVLGRGSACTYLDEAETYSDGGKGVLIEWAYLWHLDRGNSHS